MKVFKHSPQTWGITKEDYNQSGTLVWGNTEGDFYSSLPENIKIKNEIDVLPISEATDPNFDQAKLDEFNARVKKLFDSKVQEIIDGILKNKKVRINNHVNFDWLLDFTKEELRKAVYHTIQESIRNHWSEQTSQSSFNTNQLSINNDLTNWVISAQQRGTAGWNALGNSNIDKYKVIGDDFIGKFVQENSNGIVELYKWNNVELNQNKGEFNSLADAIAAITSIDKYDYVIIKDVNNIVEDNVYRFEGVDYTKQENWENKTIQQVEGDRYFVYENVILAGSQGKQGRGIASSSYDKTTGILTLTLTDGTTQTTDDLRGHNTMDDAKITAAEQEVANV